MTEEVRIVIVAEDQATPAIEGATDALKDTGNAAETAAGQTLSLRESGRLMGAGMQLAGIQGAGGIRALTTAMVTLEAVSGPVLILIAAVAAAIAGWIIAFKVASAGVSFLGESVRQALGEQATPAAVRLQNSLGQLGASVAELKSWVGQALIQAFGPAFTQIATRLAAFVRSIPAFISGVINGVIGAINAAGSGIFGFINKIIKAVNTVLALIGRLPGGRQWKPLAEVKWSPIDAFSLQGFGAGTRFDTKMGSFGGGGGGAHFGGTLEGQGANIGGHTASSGGFGGGGGGEGGSGLGLGGVRATSTASAADAINSSASQTTNAIQHLEAVNAEQMAELLRLMAAMPQAVR